MDANRLLATIKLRGYSMNAFLNGIKMPKATWSKKIRGITEFTRSEMQAIINILQLSIDEVMAIFFNLKVS